MPAKTQKASIIKEPRNPKEKGRRKTKPRCRNEE
jgi:hypothetical protein